MCIKDKYIKSEALKARSTISMMTDMQYKRLYSQEKSNEKYSKNKISLVDIINFDESKESYIRYTKTHQ